MTRPWLTLPPMLADYARAARLLHLSTAELRSMHTPPPAEMRCWRTTPEGRQWQAELEELVNRDLGWGQQRADAAWAATQRALAGEAGVAIYDRADCDRKGNDEADRRYLRRCEAEDRWLDEREGIER